MNEQHDNFNQIIKLIKNNCYCLFLYRAYKNTDIYDYEYIKCIKLSNNNLNLIIYKENFILKNIIIEKKNNNCIFKISCKTSEYLIITQFDLSNNKLYLYDLNGNEIIIITNESISDIEPYFINDNYDFINNKNTVQIYNKQKTQILLLLLNYDNTIILIKHNNILRQPLINNIDFNIEKNVLPIGQFRPLLESKLYSVLNIIYIPELIDNSLLNINCGGEKLIIEKYEPNKYNLIYNNNILTSFILIDNIEYEMYYITSSKIPIFAIILYNKLLNETNIYSYKNIKVNDSPISGLVFIIDVFIEQNIIVFKDQTNFNLSKIIVDKLYIDFNFLKFIYINNNTISDNDILTYNSNNNIWTNEKINNILKYVDGGSF